MELDGIKFDSKKEAERYKELVAKEQRGEIQSLQRQVSFELLPNQRGDDGKVIERAVRYIADFAYTEKGMYVVEDVKGYRDPSSAAYAKYTIKRKLMLWKFGIKIREI